MRNVHDNGVWQNEANISFDFNDEVSFVASIQTTEHERKLSNCNGSQQKPGEK